ncbi:MAG: GDYXXLXY domain-containing protein [Candidatus Sulfobium sp.]|jgi:uncharacterized membrane-anchored protein
MKVKFIVIVMLQVFLLTGMIAYRQHWVNTGYRILLRTAPVDPRDIFRGDYVNLRYEITNLDLDTLGAKPGMKPNDVVYVGLGGEPDGTYKAVSVSAVPPAGGKFIQGRVRNETRARRWEVSVRDDSGSVRLLRPRWFGGFDKGEGVLFCLDKRGNVLMQMKEAPSYKPRCYTGEPLRAVIEDVKATDFRQLSVEYGIESYFVEEGKGRAIEASRNARDLRVEVSLGKDGKGMITGLVMDGKVLR